MDNDTMLDKIPILFSRMDRTVLQMQCIKEHNHVYHITTDNNQTFYIKTYTKDWYGGDIEGTGYCVDHEVTAWHILSQNQLNVPAIVQYDTGCYNPLERPYLMTAAVTGTQLTRFTGADLKMPYKQSGAICRRCTP
jgi:hypothetical protein